MKGKNRRGEREHGREQGLRAPALFAIEGAPAKQPDLLAATVSRSGEAFFPLPLLSLLLLLSVTSRHDQAHQKKRNRKLECSPEERNFLSLSLSLPVDLLSLDLFFSTKTTKKKQDSSALNTSAVVVESIVKTSDARAGRRPPVGFVVIRSRV